MGYTSLQRQKNYCKMSLLFIFCFLESLSEEFENEIHSRQYFVRGLSMKAPFSEHLIQEAPLMRSLIDKLSSHFDYVSILSTDSVGFALRVSPRVKRLSQKTMTTERGHVVRLYRDRCYFEYAFNDFDPSDIQTKADEILAAYRSQQAVLEAAGVQPFETDCLADEPQELDVSFDTERLPETENLSLLTERLNQLVKTGMKEGKQLVDLSLNAQSTHISKLFQTKHRDLRQSYVYSEGSIVAVASDGTQTRVAYDGVADRTGPELFGKTFEDKLHEVLSISEDLMRADHVAPGTYDIITAPDVTGLIAHEAFGHGVEMDMFVKRRALGAEYLNQRVGSPLVTMHEGANCAVNVTSYAFDDEGTLAGDVTEIDRGILKTGICDALSALRLGVQPTGNGKRENFEHKVYTRMTNTVFDSGNDSLDDMISSIQQGYLLRGIESGMEDPKHWGIQCIVSRGYEISNGKLTGKVIAPVVMTGYVPDLLNSVSMVSPDREVFGTGGCGKGHKEWVKVADGGPYLKARANLG